MRDAFALIVPLDAPYRDLAPELAGRYVELAGGSADMAATLAAAVTAAIDRVSAGAAAGAQIDLAFTPASGAVHVELSCNGRRESVDIAIPVAKSAN